MLLCPDLRLFLLHDFRKDLEGMLIKFTHDTMHGHIADTINEGSGCKSLIVHSLVLCKCWIMVSESSVLKVSCTDTEFPKLAEKQDI